MYLSHPNTTLETHCALYQKTDCMFIDSLKYLAELNMLLMLQNYRHRPAVYCKVSFFAGTNMGQDKCANMISNFTAEHHVNVMTGGHLTIVFLFPCCQ
jgi:hypothetical protein